MKTTYTADIKLTPKDVEKILQDKFGDTAVIEFNVKDISDGYGTYGSFTFTGATVTTIIEHEWLI